MNLIYFEERMNRIVEERNKIAGQPPNRQQQMVHREQGDRSGPPPVTQRQYSSNSQKVYGRKIILSTFRVLGI